MTSIDSLPLDIHMPQSMAWDVSHGRMNAVGHTAK